ncbi:unnamed protein product [Owenia fusiformis]|uniref:Uncharacterized protein n=1 Tax=Owenia fusiformis TaxID=6347 RepID=A0A8J1U1F3_OWEFU|nr:unnamed protein product [Owenia fusiformis]
MAAKSELLYEASLFKLSGIDHKRRSLKSASSSWKPKYITLRRSGTTVWLNTYDKKPKTQQEEPKSKTQLGPRIKISKKNDVRGKPYVCELCTSNKYIYLATETQTALDLLVFMCQTQVKLKEDNEESSFIVRPEDSEAHCRIGSQGSTCFLHISPSGVTLALQLTRAVVSQWPLKCIRCYESDGNARFMLEAGRKSPMGHGLYNFNTQRNQDNEIYELLDGYIMNAADEQKRLPVAQSAEEGILMEHEAMQALTLIDGDTTFQAQINRIARDCFLDPTSSVPNLERRESVGVNSRPDLLSHSPSVQQKKFLKENSLSTQTSIEERPPALPPKSIRPPPRIPLPVPRLYVNTSPSKSSKTVSSSSSSQQTFDLLDGHRVGESQEIVTSIKNVKTEVTTSQFLTEDFYYENLPDNPKAAHMVNMKQVAGGDKVEPVNHFLDDPALEDEYLHMGQIKPQGASEKTPPLPKRPTSRLQATPYKALQLSSSKTPLGPTSSNQSYASSTSSYMYDQMTPPPTFDEAITLGFTYDPNHPVPLDAMITDEFGPDSPSIYMLPDAPLPPGMTSSPEKSNPKHEDTQSPESAYFEMSDLKSPGRESNKGARVPKSAIPKSARHAIKRQQSQSCEDLTRHMKENIFNFNANDTIEDDEGQYDELVFDKPSPSCPLTPKLNASLEALGLDTRRKSTPKPFVDLQNFTNLQRISGLSDRSSTASKISGHSDTQDDPNVIHETASFDEVRRRFSNRAKDSKLRRSLSQPDMLEDFSNPPLPELPSTAFKPASRVGPGPNKTSNKSSVFRFLPRSLGRRKSKGSSPTKEVLLHPSEIDSMAIKSPTDVHVSQKSKAFVKKTKSQDNVLEVLEDNVNTLSLKRKKKSKSLFKRSKSQENVLDDFEEPRPRSNTDYMQNEHDLAHLANEHAKQSAIMDESWTNRGHVSVDFLVSGGSEHVPHDHNSNQFGTQDTYPQAFYDGSNRNSNQVVGQFINGAYSHGFKSDQSGPLIQGDQSERLLHPDLDNARSSQLKNGVQKRPGSLWESSV